MTTVLIATTPDEVRNLLPWAAHIACSRNSELAVVLTLRKKGETRLVSVSDDPAPTESELVSQARAAIQQLSFAAESDDELATDSDRAIPVVPSAIRIHQLLGEQWTSDLSTKLLELKPSLVIAPAPTISKDQSAEDDWQTALPNEIDCDVILMQDDAVNIDQQVRVAVFISDEADNETALKYGAKLVAQVGGTATAVYVEPDFGEQALSVGRRRLDNLLGRLLKTSEHNAFRHKVIVANNLREAFGKLNTDDFDILLMGTRDLKKMRRFLQASPANTLDASPSIPAVAVVKRAESFHNRLLQKFDRAIKNFVPQLSRQERVNLVTRVEESSKWNFDFVFLISLATLIACLGLAEDSAAVIVGAMLVAPLMTPIAGVGLGVAHANSYLTRLAFRTALRGFATAICIGLIFGFVVQGCAKFGLVKPVHEFRVTASGPDMEGKMFKKEMESRTRPQFYDLLIAFASGLAAAYAMGRPNLSSAIPGVAIAAALVPPIATSGIALSHGDVTKGGGALVLFLTNMVTIILGTSLVFRAVGVRSQKAGPNAARWPRYVLFLLVVLSVLITMIIEWKKRSGA